MAHGGRGAVNGARFALACASGFVLLATAAAADPDEIPVVGRPVELPFSEASAAFVRDGDELLCPFHVETSVATARVEVEQPLTLTVTIHARGPVLRPPVRIDLRDISAFKRTFHIEDVTDGQKEKVDPTTWRWVYRLKPRRAGIDEVPRLPFVFYNPDLRPPEKAFQAIWTDPRPITVTPAEPVGPTVDYSERVMRIGTGPAVLVSSPPWSGPGRPLLIATLALPPLLCAVWYLLWRRLYPDAARQARQRRSRAARRALAGLDAAARLSGRARAEAVTKAVVGYLRERLEQPIAEPTPDEAAAWLSAHAMTEQASQVRLLLADCAAERFAPDERGAELIDAARAVINAIEEPPCPPSS